jgi:hypothetical protein
MNKLIPLAAIAAAAYTGRRGHRAPNDVQELVVNGLQSLPKRDRGEAAKVLKAVVQITKADYKKEQARWGQEAANKLASSIRVTTQEIAEKSLGSKRRRRTRTLLYKLRDVGLLLQRSRDVSYTRRKAYNFGRDARFVTVPEADVRWGLPPILAQQLIARRGHRKPKGCEVEVTDFMVESAWGDPEGGYRIQAMCDGSKVGETLVEVYPETDVRRDLSPRCQRNLRAQRRKHNLRTPSVARTAWTRLDNERQRTGLGTAMYQEAVNAAHDLGIPVAPDACFMDGSTSDAAWRVWQRKLDWEGRTNRGRRTARKSLIEAAQGICTPGNYLNCQLFTQLLTNTPRLYDLPVTGRERVGDVLQYGSNPARHWAVYIGNDEVLHVPEWGGELEIASWDAVEREHGPPIIRKGRRATQTCTDGRTDPALWAKVKKEVTAGSKGGRPGQWSARKAQMAVQTYKARGGTYCGPKTKAQKSLTRWTKEDWGSDRPGDRYLPKKAREALTDEEYRRTSAKKRRDTAKGKQFSKQPAKIAKKTALKEDR